MLQDKGSPPFLCQAFSLLFLSLFFFSYFSAVITEGIDNKIFGLDPLNRSPISPKEIKRGRFLQKEVAAN